MWSGGAGEERESNKGCMGWREGRRKGGDGGVRDTKRAMDYRGMFRAMGVPTGPGRGGGGAVWNDPAAFSPF